MFKINTDDGSFKEIKAYAQKTGKPIKEVLLSDEYLKDISHIFYSYMPKLIKWKMKEEQFEIFYKNHRKNLVDHLLLE